MLFYLFYVDVIDYQLFAIMARGFFAEFKTAFSEGAYLGVCVFAGPYGERIAFFAFSYFAAGLMVIQPTAKQ